MTSSLKYVVADEAVEVFEFFEDATITGSMRLNFSGSLHIQGQLFEETRSHGGKMALTNENNFHAQLFIEDSNISCDVIGITGGSGSGGTTFECISEGEYTASMPASGIGFDAAYVGLGQIGLVYQNTFEQDPTGSYTEGSSSIMGFINFYVGDGP